MRAAHALADAWSPATAASPLPPLSFPAAPRRAAGHPATARVRHHHVAVRRRAGTDPDRPASR